MTTVRMEPRGYFRRVPLAPEEMTDRRTRTEHAIVLCHVGVPQIARHDWRLRIDGMVEQPLALAFDDLSRWPKVEIASVHQCAGSPLQPFEPARRICNVAWSGVRLSDVLRESKPDAAASFLWTEGADSGEFNGVSVEGYTKDLPIARIDDDVLIATEMNGAPLRPEHGFPARLVAPGFYGTNSVKWLTRITVASRRADSPFTTRWYNDPVLDQAGQPTSDTIPVWAIAPESVIVSPASGTELVVGQETTVWGWAWCDGGAERVEISVDDGATWRQAELEPPRGREWQRFAFAWRPIASGAVRLTARATSRDGAMQPASGRRNAWHSVAVQVRSFPE